MKAFSALALSLFLSGAWAYVLSGSRWPSPEATFVYDLANPERTSPSGISWNQAFEQAMARWSERTVFTFRGQPGTSADPCHEDGLNTVAFRRDECGFAFGSTTLAITYSFFSRGRLRETDIVFNANEAWDVYDGPLRHGATDFTRVAVHELGHALGLDHEDRLPAIMASRVGDLSLPQKDDLQGVAALYGGLSPLPAACQMQALPLNAWIQGRLEAADCRRLDIAESEFASDDSAVDLYALELPTAGLLVVQMNSERLDPYLEIRQGQQILASDDDSGSGTNALISIHLPQGRYQLVANSATSWLQTGDYRLKVSIGLDQPTALLEENLSLSLASVDVNGTPFQARLSFYANPDDPQGRYWRLENYGLLQGEPLPGAVLLPESADLVLNPVAAFGRRYDVRLKRYFVPQDPFGWYWKLDQVFERN